MLDRIKRRLSPTDRVRFAKAEKANEPREVPPGEDGFPYGPSSEHFPEVAQRLREYDRAKRRADDTRRALRATGEEPSACELHPEWKPKSFVIGQPSAPKHWCPFCREAARPSGRVEQIVVEHPLNTKNIGAAAEATYVIEERDETEAVEHARANPESFAGAILRSPDGLAAARSGRFQKYLETCALDGIDKGRERDRSNLLPTHPDFPRSSGPFFRKAAFSTPGASTTRRASASKYWKKSQR